MVSGCPGERTPLKEVGEIQATFSEKIWQTSAKRSNHKEVVAGNEGGSKTA